MIPERRNSSACIVCQEFQVKQCSSTLRKTAQNFFPTPLSFIAVRELNVCMFEREFIFRKFFETDYDVVCGGVFPGSFWDEGCANSFEFRVVEDAFRGVFNVDFVACVDELDTQILAAATGFE